MTRLIERTFGVRAAGSTIRVEVRAGVATFLTMAYILLVNPQILSAAGMPAADVATATAVAAAVGCFAMAFLANYPFALAPGMGLNAYFAFTLVLGSGVSWEVALAAVFVEGLLFLVLSVTGLRSALLESIPASLKLATAAGIGVLLAFLGLRAGGIVVADEATLVGLGELGATAGLFALGLLCVAVLQVRRVAGAMIVGILVTALAAWATQQAPLPESWAAVPAAPETLFALDFGGLLEGTVVLAVLALFLVDLLDTAGTLAGVGQLGGFVDERGNLERSRGAFAADALATMAGALVGTSTVTTYVESSAGVEEGGKTGLVAFVVGLLFLSAIFLAPLFVAVPAVATAPVLVAVGALMMRSIAKIEWNDIAEALPAFLVITVMPLTFSIANGIAAGVLAWIVVRVVAGRWREIGVGLWTLAALLVVFFALGA